MNPITSKSNEFPGGSKSKVNRAGDSVRAGTASNEDIKAIDDWRAAHRAVLNTFQAILRNRTKGTDIVVGQRHKRKKTIFDKLTRLPKMKLVRMDDVAGCRLIFADITELYKFREKLHKARFSHKRRNEVDKYDYIKAPKSTGYRGIHDVYIYDVNSEKGKKYKGLLVELQYRTQIQHAWATTVEVIGFITGNQPKFQRGDKRYERIMVLASEILARAYEDRRGSLPEIRDKSLVGEFLKLDDELKLIQTLRGLNQSTAPITEKRNTILIFNSEEELEIQTFKDATSALKALFRLEKERPDKDIVLVKADTSEEVRIAFKNYFSDATDFIKLLENGCQLLTS